MELIKSWIFSLCGASMIASVIKIIFHGSKLKKSVNVFLSLFLLFYMLSPFTNGTEIGNLETAESKIESNEINYSKTFVETAISNVCVEHNCNIISINIDSFENDSEIIIRTVTLTINDKSKCETIQKEIFEKFGFEVDVNWTLKV